MFNTILGLQLKKKNRDTLISSFVVEISKRWKRAFVYIWIHVLGKKGHALSKCPTITASY